MEAGNGLHNCGPADIQAGVTAVQPDTMTTKVVTGAEESKQNADSVSGNSEQSADDLIASEPSKNQLKKQAKQQRWLKKKADVRAHQREKKRKKRETAKLENRERVSRKKLKKNSMENSSCRISVAIDCSFDNEMSERCIMQLVQQLQHTYAANRRALNPLQLYVTDLGNKTLQRLDSLGDYKGWDVNFKSESYIDLFGRENIVYLSSESPNVLSRLDANKCYVIGGLVDHNHLKGLCHRLAEEKGVAHARLAIDKHIDLKTRHVLTINHVFEILLQFTETNDWEAAFETVIPKRKGAVPKCALPPSAVATTEGGVAATPATAAEADVAPVSPDGEAIVTREEIVKVDGASGTENALVEINSSPGGAAGQPSADSEKRTEVAEETS